jgi:hypothetical protein
VQSLLPLGNIGDVLDSMWMYACACTGFIIIPSTLVVWGLAFYWRAQKSKKAVRMLLVAMIATFGLIFWIVGWFGLGRSYPVKFTDADFEVFELPEMLAMRGRTVTSFSGQAPLKLGYWEFDIDKIEEGGRKVSWHKFLVNQNNGRILVFANERNGIWLTIEEWRNLSTTQPEALQSK